MKSEIIAMMGILLLFIIDVFKEKI